MLRKMTHEFHGRAFYGSTFDQATGTLVRVVEVRDPETGHAYCGDGLASSLFPELGHKKQAALNKEWDKHFGFWRSEAFSPSPETLDLSITNWCNFGCSYCYMDSRPELTEHVPVKFVEDVIKSFDIAPYQMAIGGGEPTGHPGFPEILFRVRELGTVPNYTTAGHIFRQEVIDATNAACGGVSMTFHAFKGAEWFVEHYKRLRKALKVQMNVHLIADRDVAVNLDLLRNLQSTVGPLRVVLLAFYPDVGRANLTRIMPKTVYDGTFPVAIKAAVDSGMKVAFSEGLLPYFFSRPGLGVETTFASRSEGLFSAYVDAKGRMSNSSFDPPNENYPTLYEESLQKQWFKLRLWHSKPSGANCYNCLFGDRCSTPNPHHYFACAFAGHNTDAPPLTESAKAAEAYEIAFRRCWGALEEFEKREGRKATEAEKNEIMRDFQAASDAKTKRWEKHAETNKVSLTVVGQNRTGP